MRQSHKGGEWDHVRYEGIAGKELIQKKEKQDMKKSHGNLRSYNPTKKTDTVHG